METIYYLFLSCFIFVSTCLHVEQSNQCSTTNASECFQITPNSDYGICAFLHLNCSQLRRCETVNNICPKSDHICVKHPRCDHRPLCYPLIRDQQYCLFKKNSSSISQSNDNLCAKSTWSQNGSTVAGGNGQGSELNQLNNPFGLFVDQNKSIYIADSRNNGIVKWDLNVTNGLIVPGNGRSGIGSNQLDNPQDIFVDNNGTIYISDTMNGRVQQWIKGDSNGQTIIENVTPIGISEDNEGSIYISDWLIGQVTKWNRNGTIEEIIISNLTFPYTLFVDQNQSIYVTDTDNSRVIKIDNQTKNVSIVAGGSPGGNFNQLSWPEGVIVDQLGNVYVADTRNHRIMQWPPGVTSGNVIVGGQGAGSASNQLYYPSDLSFDLEGNLYVVDNGNHRVQKYIINKSLC